MISTCLIPPFAHLNLVQHREHHLLLTHLLEDPRYLQFYQSIRSVNPGCFLTLDNSAHELEEGLPIRDVFKVGESIGANELVIPDHLFDREVTLRLAVDSLSEIIKLQDTTDFRPRLMLVAQGRSRSETIRCVWDQIRTWENFSHDLGAFQPTIGISKDYEIWPGGLIELVREAIIPAADAIGAQIHLLGWGRDLWALREIAEQHGDRIRSVDSAKPFVYAMGGITLNPRYRDLPTYPRRAENYFDVQMTSEQFFRSLQNVNVFDATARGEVI